MSIRPKLSEVIASIAVIISLIALVSECSTKKELNKTQYSLSQITHRPNLKVLKTEFSKIRYFMDTDDVNKVQKTNNDTSFIEVQLGLKTRIYITNVGNSMAKIQGQIYTDMTSGKSYIKKALADDSIKVSYNPIDSYYDRIDLNVGDTTIIERDFRIQNIIDGAFTLHMYFYYKNELNQGFDSYHWVRYQTKTVFLPLGYDEKKHKKRPKIDGSNLTNAIKYVDHHNETNSFDIDEMSLIEEQLKNALTKNKSRD